MATFGEQIYTSAEFEISVSQVYEMLNPAGLLFEGTVSEHVWNSFKLFVYNRNNASQTY